MENLDYRQYPEYNSFYERKGWVVEKVNGSYVLIRELPIFGSVIKIKRCYPEICLQKIDELAKKYNALFIKLELNLTSNDPRSPNILEKLKRSGYKRSNFVFCPTKTIYIDLTLSREKLLDRTKKDVKRYLRKNRGKKFKFFQDKNIDDFYPLLAAAGKIKGYLVPNIEDFKILWGEYGDDLKLILGYKGGELLGGTMTLCRHKMAFGIYMSLSKKGLVEKFSYSLLWESIKVAKEAGCETLDFDGIYDPRYKSRATWKGLTEFKRKFGGNEVEFLGGFIKCNFIPLKVFAKYGYL